MPLLYGDLQFIDMTKDTWVFIRSYFEESVVVVFNKSNKPADIEFSHPRLEGTEAEAFNMGIRSRKGDTITLELEPNSFEIIKIK